MSALGRARVVARRLAFARFAVPLALLAIAAATSTVHREPPWTTARLGEHLVLEGDVHVHTSFAGALSTPVDIPLLARRNQVDFVAITEHNAWFGGWVTQLASRVLTPEVVVLPSEEITNRDYHLLAIGLQHRVDPTLPLSAIADDVHRQGGLMVAAHPTRGTWPLLLGLAARGGLDGAEVFHPTIFRTGGRAQEHADFLAEASRLAGRTLLAFGSSDFHGGSRLGVCRTLVLARERSAASILEAMREGRVVATTFDGRWAGDPRWIEALRSAGYTSRAAEEAGGARSTHASHAPERALAWLALAVMVAALFRPLRPRAPADPPPAR